MYLLNASISEKSSSINDIHQSYKVYTVFKDPYFINCNGPSFHMKLPVTYWKRKNTGITLSNISCCWVIL